MEGRPSRNGLMQPPPLDQRVQAPPMYAHPNAGAAPYHHLQLLQAPTLLHHPHHPLAHHDALPPVHVPPAPSLPPGMYSPSPYMAPTGPPIPMDMAKGKYIQVPDMLSR